jgi:hypothetical protein
MHGAMGPACAIAQVNAAPDSDGIQVTIWSGTQGPYPLRDAIAGLLNVPVSAVRVIYAEGSGCYGHNGADDVAADAALMSAAAGQPLRVQWMRTDEHGWEPLGPAMVHEMKGGLDASQSIVPRSALPGYRSRGLTPEPSLYSRRFGSSPVGTIRSHRPRAGPWPDAASHSRATKPSRPMSRRASKSK